MQHRYGQLRHVQLGYKVGDRVGTTVLGSPLALQFSTGPSLDCLDSFADLAARPHTHRVCDRHVDVLVLRSRPNLLGKVGNAANNQRGRTRLACCARHSVSNPHNIPRLQATVDVLVVAEWRKARDRGEMCSTAVASQVWGVGDIRDQVALVGVLLQEVVWDGFGSA